jgi:hypothetical protein
MDSHGGMPFVQLCLFDRQTEPQRAELMDEAMAAAIGANKPIGNPADDCIVKRICSADQRC